MKLTQVAEIIAIAFIGGVLSHSESALAHALPPILATQALLPAPTPPPNPTIVAAGFYHSCAIRYGSARCWGDNRDGQIGDGTSAGRNVSTNVIGLNGIVTEITAGAYHSCALVNGGAKCWGHNTYGQVGDSSTTHRYSPVNVVGLNAGVIAISAGGFHTCALTSSGTVKCWGVNFAGQLGNGTTANQYTPVDVPGLNNVIAIRAGYAHTCALLNSGNIQCWGDDSAGQLGDGISGNYETLPVPVNGLSGKAIAIAAGGEFTCAGLRDGRAQCWGDNSYGELGDGTNTNHALPAAVIGLNGPINAIATGTTSACVIISGAGQCWGDNSSGQLGDDTTANHSTPTQIIGLSGATAVAVGDQHACAQTASLIKCWGRDYFGELGDNAYMFRAAPDDVASLANANAIGAGGHHTCALVNSGVKCWGWNLHGQIGDGTTVDRLIPTNVITFTSAANQIGVGYAHNCAIANTGTVRCWGSNASGQIGDGTFTDKLDPVDVSGVGNGAISIGAGYSHTCTAMNSGNVKCWGDNTYGELGNGTSGSGNLSPTPVDVIGLDNIVQVAAGYLFNCALTVNGGVECWGWNLYGQLGDGTNVDRPLPTNVSGLTSGVTSISAGWYHACAVMTSGDLKCWGSNGSGQLGDGTTIDRSIPVDVIGLTSNVSTVTGGWQHTCALTSSGGAKCWGLNFNGAIGDGTTTSRLSPVNVTGLNSGVLAISAGQNYTCALLANGGGKCWGFNYYGQLGNNQAGHRTIPATVVWNLFYYFPWVNRVVT